MAAGTDPTGPATESPARPGVTPPDGTDFWVEFNDLDGDGLLATYADWVRPGVRLAVGAMVVVGDGEGNRARAAVVGLGRSGVRPRVVLRVHMATFTPVPGP